MNAIERPLRAADRFQQRWPVLAVPVAVWSKFNDDQAGNLAALISYYGFAALFPLLLVLVTVLNMLLANDPSLRATLLNSALAQYPVIGQQIKASLGHISGTGLPLIIGIVFLLLGARGVASAMTNALCEVWDIPREDRPGFPMSQVWAMALMFSVGIGFIVTTFLSGLAGGAGHVISGAVAHVGAVLISLVLNIGMFWLGFRIATVFKVRWRDLLIGSAIAAICWQALQVVGGYVVSHQLHRASELYGTFGIVLGLLAWLFLQAEVTLYAAEVDAVLARGLWPVSLPGAASLPGGDSPGDPPDHGVASPRSASSRGNDPPGDPPSHGRASPPHSPPTGGLAKTARPPRSGRGETPSPVVTEEAGSAKTALPPRSGRGETPSPVVTEARHRWLPWKRLVPSQRKPPASDKRAAASDEKT